jgi:NADPH:quinone reductase-like Zn-dependent oxidoreductase
MFPRPFIYTNFLKSGTIAIQLAKKLGAAKVIGVARNASALATLGLDDTIVLQPTETDFSKLGDVDIVLDYLYGPPTEQLFKSLTTKRPVQ